MNTMTQPETLANLETAMEDESIGGQVAGLARYFLETGVKKTDVLRLIARASVEAGIPAAVATEFARVLCGAGKTLADAGVGQ